MHGACEQACVDHKSEEEAAGGDAVKYLPVVLVEDADHGQADHGDNAEPHHGVEAAVGDLAVELLVEGAEVDLLHSEHEDRGQQDESAVVHLLV
ncbi:MAG: hypothetical protein ACK56F_09275, partial [bacterium]